MWQFKLILIFLIDVAQSKIDIEERGKKWVFKTICSSWKTNKCRLKKKHFNANMTEVYNLKNRPSSVPLEQWRILMKYWKSSKVVVSWIHYFLLYKHVGLYLCVNFYYINMYAYILVIVFILMKPFYFIGM
jgi:hypothetical protein